MTLKQPLKPFAVLIETNEYSLVANEPNGCLGSIAFLKMVPIMPKWTIVKGINDATTFAMQKMETNEFLKRG